MSGEEPDPFDRVVEPWQAVVEDMEGLAAEYREIGWEVLELHPGDVATLDGGGDSGDDGDDGTGGDSEDDRHGLEVLVPDPEFEELEAWIEEGARFGSYEVYRTTEDEVVFLLVVLTDEATERAVCVPAYYETSSVETLRTCAEHDGVFFTYVRRLQRDRVITFTGDDPGLFLPG